MGLGNPIVSFRGDLDNIFFIEHLHQNVFPFLSRSQIINVVITWCRLYADAQKIDLQTEFAQRVLKINLYTQYTDLSKPSPRKASAPQKGRVVA